MIVLVKHQPTPVSEFLERHYEAWRVGKIGRTGSITAFANYIGISRDVLNTYMLKGKKPDGQNLKKIAEVLGNEIYELAGAMPDDPLKKLFLRLVDSLSPEGQEDLLEYGKRLKEKERRASEQAPENENGKGSGEPQRTVGHS